MNWNKGNLTAQEWTILFALREELAGLKDQYTKNKKVKEWLEKRIKELENK
jgi:hypothetical protein